MTTGQSGSAHGLHRLADALELYLAAAQPDAALLASRPDLRDLLEPLLQPRPTPELVRLGEFELLREIGRGGMGIVYEAIQAGLDRRVALKVLPAHLTLDAASVTRFLREASTMAQLDHPSIVKVFSVGSDQGCHYFAMELIDGGALRIERRPIRQCVELAAGLADALAHAHQAGLIHRDVKPGNILVRSDGTPVLTDFGLARSTERPDLTRTGAIAGTLSYMAPEQLAGTAVDARVDIWALGATLYELITLQRPFAAGSDADLAWQIRAREPLDPRRIDRTLPLDLCAIVQRALEKEPGRRYQDAHALAQDLRAFLAFRPVQARRASASVRMWRWVKREPRRAALVGSFAVVLAVAVGLGVNHLAERETLAAGRARLRAEKLEELVAAGYLDVFDEPAQGLARFEAALELAPELPEVVLGVAIGRAKLRRDWRGFLAAQPAHLREHPALRRWVHAMEHGDAILPEPATDPLDLAIAVQLRLFQGELREQSEYRTELVMAQRAVAASPRPRLYLHDFWAVAASYARDAEQAEVVAEALVRHWPDSALAWNYAGFALLVVSLDRALPAYERAVRIDPGLSWAHGGIGYIHKQLGNQDAAIAALRRAIAINPRYRQSIMNLGFLLDGRGELDGAREQFARAVAIDPGFAKAHHALVAVLGKLDDQAGVRAEEERWRQREAAQRNH